MNRRLNSHDVIEVLTDLLIERGVTDHIRSDNGSEFIARRVRECVRKFQVCLLYIETDSPWENGYVKTFKLKMRDELLNGEIFYYLKETILFLVLLRTH